MSISPTGSPKYSGNADPAGSTGLVVLGHSSGDRVDSAGTAGLDVTGSVLE